PQTLFWTMEVPFWMLVEPKVSQITGAACEGLARATATGAPVPTICAAQQAARTRLIWVCSGGRAHVCEECMASRPDRPPRLPMARDDLLRIAGPAAKT